MGVVLYALVPLLLPDSWTWATAQFDEAMRSEGELAIRLVLLFSVACFTLTAALTMRGKESPSVIAPHSWRRAALVAALGLVAAAAYGAWQRTPANPLLSLLGEQLSRQVLDSIPPLLCAMTAYFALNARRNLPLAGVALVTGAGLLLAHVAQHTIKLPILIGTAILAATLIGGRPRGLRPVLGFLVATAALGFSFLTVFQARYPAQWKAQTVAESVSRSVEIKIGERFTITQVCLARVLENHWQEPGKNPPFYFASALIPRALWPEKPSISHGLEVNRTYCGSKTDFKTSMSTTLLGEPVMYAGAMGLAVAAPVLALILGCVGALAHRQGFLTRTWVVAMTPWLVDFDQSFAMYVANGLKMGIVVGVALLILRQSSRTHPSGAISSR